MSGACGESPSEARSGGLFALTQWSVVLQAKADSSAALNNLLTTYREPLLRWLRLQNLPKSLDPEDLLQDFYVALMRRNFLGSVERERGKFRTFLLTALRNYLIDALDKLKSGRRNRGVAPLSLDDVNEDGAPLRDPAAAAALPDKEFDQQWARAILDAALRQLVDESSQPAVVVALQPVFFRDPDAESLQAIAAKVGMTEANVKVVAHRLRKTLARILRDRVSQTVADEAQLEEELRYLRELFARPASGFAT